MTLTIKNIAIVGVTGTIGTHITQALLAKNRFSITAISRPDSNANFPPEVKVVRVNYDDHNSIVEGLRGHDALIITTSVWAPRDTSAKLIRAAAAVGIPWILPNEFGMFNTEEAANETIGPGKQQDRELIESLGVSSWIGISCGFWYEHSLSSLNGELYGIDLKNHKAKLFDDGHQRLNTSTWQQVGRAVAALLSLPIEQQDAPTMLNMYRNRMMFVSSFTVNQKEMLESAKRVTGTGDEDWTITFEPAKQRYEDACENLKKGDRIAFGKKLYTRYFYEDAGLFEKLHGLDNEKLGLPKEDLDKATEAALELAQSGYWANYGQH
ncbi:hypothetical protein E8E12_008836 [Didymella heteroderae]|uniref:NmrA-like domain-containing protein n=1 Tax=Didymella heteroderae TaxID=1769908 RepID=A0A9P4WZL1_9PLEO|nr:hypothetical protein E8E12_008836 [Didymella heteroderae]